EEVSDEEEVLEVEAAGPDEVTRRPGRRGGRAEYEDDRTRRRRPKRPKRKPPPQLYDDDSNPLRDFFTGRRVAGILSILFGVVVVCTGILAPVSANSSYRAGQYAGLITGVLFVLAGVLRILFG